MHRTNINITDAQQAWLDRHDEIVLSEEVRGMLDEKMEMEDWAAPEIDQEGGIVLGRNQVTGHQVRYDLLGSPYAGNWLSIGGVGAGKTGSAMVQFSQLLSTDDSQETPLIVSIDATHEMKEFVENHGGLRIQLGSDANINPLTTREPATSRQEETRKKSLLLRGFFHELFDLIGSTDSPYGIGARSETALMDVLYSMYQTHGIDLDDSSTYGNGDPTLRDDLVPELIKFSNRTGEFEEDGENRDMFHSQEAESLLMGLSPVLRGEAGGMFNGQTTFELDDSRDIINLELDHLTPTDDISLILYALIMEVYEFATSTDRDVILQINNGRGLIDHPNLVDALNHMLASGRTHGIGFHYTMHSLEELANSAFFDAVWSQTGHKLIHNDESVGMKSKNKAALTETQANFVRSCELASSSTNYSEAMLSLPGVEWQPLTIQPDDIDGSMMGLTDK